ncbi:transketolase [Amycolatopsis sp. NPDC003676]
MTTAVRKPDREALEARADRIREHIVEMCSGPEGGHLGGSMSSVEILVALFFHVMNINPADAEGKGRDVFVLSKGHSAMALYATLAERGYFPPDEIPTFCRPGSRLATHGNVAVPGVEFATGSLGHGLALANGVAWAQRKVGTANTFVLVGDGELQEGSVWEAAQVSRAFDAGNLVVVVDANDFQQTGSVYEVSDGASPAQRWSGFGWHTVEADGHDLPGLCAALEDAAATGEPTAVVCRTVKGNGAGLLAGRAVSHFVRLDAAKRRRVEAGMQRGGPGRG